MRVGRVIQPTQVILTDEAVAACPIHKTALFKTDVAINLMCGAPLLVDVSNGDEHVIHCTTVPYMSICTGFYAPRDRVRVHERITFDPVEGEFVVWDKTHKRKLSQFYALRLAEQSLERFLNAEGSDAGTEDNG